MFSINAKLEVRREIAEVKTPPSVSNWDNLMESQNESISDGGRKEDQEMEVEPTFSFRLPAKLRFKRSFQVDNNDENPAKKMKIEDAQDINDALSIADEPLCLTKEATVVENRETGSNEPANVTEITSDLEEPLNLKVEPSPTEKDLEQPSCSKAHKKATAADLANYNASEPIFGNMMATPKGTISVEKKENDNVQAKELKCKIINIDNDQPKKFHIPRSALGNLKDILGNHMDLPNAIKQFSEMLKGPICAKTMLAAASVGNAGLMEEELNKLPGSDIPQQFSINKSAKKLNGMPEKVKDLLSKSEGDSVILGPNGTSMERKAFLCINWKVSKSNIMRKILLQLFGKEKLAFSSLTGKKSPAFVGVDKPEKDALDPKMIEDVKYFGTEVLLMKAKEVHGVIVTKCADEQKMFRQRLKKVMEEQSEE